MQPSLRNRSPADGSAALTAEPHATISAHLGAPSDWHGIEGAFAGPEFTATMDGSSHKCAFRPKRPSCTCLTCRSFHIAPSSRTMYEPGDR